MLKLRLEKYSQGHVQMKHRGDLYQIQESEFSDIASCHDTLTVMKSAIQT